MNYEINKFTKVTNTNCTSCLLCISGCPSNALSYSYENPIKEKVSLLHYLPTKDKLNAMMNKGQYFKSIRSWDWLYLILIFIFANSISGIYGIGHFLAYGIAIISSFIIINNKINTKYLRYGLNSLIFILFFWHALIKVNIYLGTQYYEINSPTFLQKTIQWYAKKTEDMK